MSLASLLLPSSFEPSKKAKTIDTELDALFRTQLFKPNPLLSTVVLSHGVSASPGLRPLPVSSMSSNPTAKKRKRGRGESAQHAKRPKYPMGALEKEVSSESMTEDRKKGSQAGGVETKKNGRHDDRAMLIDEEDLEKELDDDEDGSEGNSDLENAYYRAHLKRQPPSLEAGDDTTDEDKSSSEDALDAPGPDVHGGLHDVSTPASASDFESDGDPSMLLHETAASPKKTISSRRTTKYVPPDETSEQRDLRTIFVGNLSIEVAQKRSALKQLHRHILSRLPNAKIESTRFRSVAFQNPTNKLNEEGTTHSQHSNPGVETSTSNPHSRSRAASWRERQSGADAEDLALLKQDEKKYLTPAQKKKVAFIHHEFHSSASTVNAYIVFAHPPPSTPTSNNESNAPFMINPYDAAKKAVELFDGTMFGERMIRVDVALRGTARAKHKSSLGDVGMGGADPKFSVFVGNLDFESREEDLRVYFEGVIAAERGPPEDAMEMDDGDEDAENDKKETKLKKPKTWVTRVRIVRDKETQLGKGFAYVQFADGQCVDEILAMEEGKLKFAKRKLRVQRCKTIPGVTIPSKSLSTSTTTKPPNAKIATVTHRRPIPVPVVPKGDPTLGAKLAGMSKYERKEVKATNADRIARRLAKKKARIAFGNASVKVVRKESGEKTRERRRHPRDA